MTIYEILAWIIVTIICLIVAPFMTIGVIFIGAGWKILGFISVLIGIIHMIFKIILAITN